jgi:hypothetical protein
LTQINDNLFTVTHANRALPLQRHFWGPTDGEQIQAVRQQQTPTNKRLLSETQGDLFGQHFAIDILGYQPYLHPDSKSIRQGFDAVFYDPQTQAYVIAEFKGQTSQESTLQSQPDWPLTTCQKIINSQPPYQQVSEYERQIAQTLLQLYDRGAVLRYEVIRSGVDSQNRHYTQLEKQTRLEKQHTLENPTITRTPHPNRFLNR